jgi:hypothetical protein
LQHNVFPGQALAKCGEEVSEQDLARRDVAHHPVQADCQITRAVRHTTNVRSAQRRGGCLLAANMLIENGEHAVPFLGASRRGAFGQRSRR